MGQAESGKDKVKKICEVLRRETLDPAKKEADAIIGRAREEGARIIEEAKQEARVILEEGQRKIKEEHNVFQASINVACKKSLDVLRQKIENTLFHQGLRTLIGEKMGEPEVISALISAIVTAIEKEGIEGDLRAVIPSSVSAQRVNKQLVKGVLKHLENNSVTLGDISGGVEVKLVEKNLTIDMSEEALKSLIAGYVRDDFRAVIFGA